MKPVPRSLRAALALGCIIAVVWIVLVSAPRVFGVSPILTAVGTPPRAGSAAFPIWVDSCFTWSYTQCPLARTTTYYINQGTNTNANPDLGTQGTSASSPRNCNTWADVVTFAEDKIADAGGDVRIRLDQNDSWWLANAPADATTTAYTLNISYPNVTIDAYDSTATDKTGPATGHARILGGYPIGWAANDNWLQATSGNTGLTSSYTSVYCAQGATAGAFTAMGGLNTASVAYVTFDDYQRDSSITRTDEFRERYPFRRYPPLAAASIEATVAAMHAADENAFVFDTTNNRVYVKLSAATGLTMDSNAYLMVLYKTKACIKIGSNSSTTVTGCRIDNLDIIGFGMSDPANNEPPIWFDISGNAIGLVSRCKVTFGSRHLIELYGSRAASGTTYYGGSMVVDECEVGFHSRYDSATIINANSSNNGDMELLCRNVRGIGVALKGWNSGAAGSTQLIYSHTSGAGEKIALQLSVGCGWNENILNPDGLLYSLGARSADISTTGMDTYGIDTTKYRCFEVGTVNHSNWIEFPGGEPKVYVNCYHSIAGMPSAFSSPGGGGGGSAHKAVLINSIIHVNDTLAKATTCEWFQNTTASPGWLHMVNSLLVFKPGQYYSTRVLFCADAANDDYAHSYIFNSGVLKIPQRSGTIYDTVTNPANQAPSSSQGGAAGLIVGPGSLKTTSGNHQGYDSTSNPIFISYVPSEPFRLIGLMQDLADQAEPVTVPELRVDYDMFFRPRNNDAGPTGGSGTIGDVRNGAGNNIWLAPRRNR